MHKKTILETCPFFWKLNAFIGERGWGVEVPFFSNVAPFLALTILPFFQSRINSAVEQCKDELFLIKKYKSKDIFHSDETGLLFQHIKVTSTK